jgi:predicted CoA-binding protein
VTLSDPEIRRLLEHATTIAVVGLSDKTDRDSYQIAAFLQAQRYRIIPVNPAVPEVLGERSYPSLSAIPPEIRVDLVDIFRRSDQVPPIVEEALHRGVGGIWMQLGVTSPEAAQRAEGQGTPVLQDRCIRVEHRRLGVHRSGAPASGGTSPRTS